MRFPVLSVPTGVVDVDRKTVMYVAATTTAVCALAGLAYRELTARSRADGGIPVANWNMFRSITFSGDPQHPHEVLRAVDDKGTLVRLPVPPTYPNVYVLADPHYARDFLETENEKPSTRSKTSTKNLVSRNTENDGWHETRKPVSRGFSQKNLQDIANCHKLKLRALFGVLDQHAKSGAEFDLNILLFRMSLDVMLEAMFHCPSTSVAEPMDTPVEKMSLASRFIKANHEYVVPTFLRITLMLPWQKAQLRALDQQRKAPHKVRVETGDFLTKNYLKNHAHKNEDDRTVIGLICNNKFYKESFDRMSNDIRTLIAAGHDLPAMSVTFFLYYMCKNPRVLAKVVEEIDRVLGDRDMPNMNDQFPYLELCIKETWRMSPISGRGPWRETQKDYKVNEYTIPAGSMVNTSVHSLFKGKWVNDRDSFIPERFEKGAPQAELLNKNIGLIFSAGKRVCVGLRKAAVDVRLSCAALARNFNFELKQEPVTETWLILGVRSLDVTCTRRARVVEADLGA